MTVFKAESLEAMRALGAKVDHGPKHCLLVTFDASTSRRVATEIGFLAAHSVPDGTFSYNVTYEKQDREIAIRVFR